MSIMTQEKTENRMSDISSDRAGLGQDNVNEFLEKHAEEVEKVRKALSLNLKRQNLFNFPKRNHSRE